MAGNKENNAGKAETLDRRKFLQSTAAAGASLVLNPAVLCEASGEERDDINVAVIGLGEQWGRLRDAFFKTRMDNKEGIRIKAVCDIWPYRLKRSSGLLQKAYKHDVAAYESYEEMLAKEKDLDAVIIVTPDWMHAEMTIASLKAGLHVYCEKEMSNNLADAKRMVETARETGKLLQIGHQRRSNPRYQVAEKLIREHKLIGKLLNINAQWNRGVVSHRIPLPKEKIWLDKTTLNKYGYGSMDELVNWRWYKKFGGGPLGDLGSHQIDIFNWFLGDVKPKAVLAIGGKDYYNYEHHENVMTVYEYETEENGSVRAFYQVLNTTCWGTYGGYYETFMGDIGTLLISEIAGDKDNGWIFLEDYAKADEAVVERWNNCIRMNLVGGEYEMPQEVKDGSILRIGASIPGGRKALYYHPLLRKLKELVHQPHLKNFFDAIRGEAELACPGKVGYETAVAVLKANQAIEQGGRIDFKEEDFKV